MSKFEEVSTDILLIDFRETEQWLRDYPHGENRSMVKTRTAAPDRLAEPARPTGHRAARRAGAATVASGPVHMVALTTTTFLTDPGDPRELREAILVSCVAREGTMFRESSFAAWMTGWKTQPRMLGAFAPLTQSDASAIAESLRAALSPPADPSPRPGRASRARSAITAGPRQGGRRQRDSPGGPGSTSP